MKASVWPHFDLLYLHDGSLEMEVEGRGLLSLAAGEGVLLFPNTPFRPYGKSSRVKASVQHFSLDDATNLPAPFDVLIGHSMGSVVRQGPRNDRLESDITRSMELATAAPTPMLPLMREALLTLILGEFLQTTLPDPAQNKHTDALTAWAEGQSMAKLSVETLADRAGITPSGLRRRFLTDIKITPQQYLVNLRINEAARLLRETSMPIKEIAQRVGYGSAVAFHNAFRKARQETPGSYRKNHRTVG
ncbi:MAG: helix-turn-helix domain-containing protein [Akkermansiaceae bacterium]